jgi:hypothetical protein
MATDGQAKAGRSPLRAALGIDAAWTCTQPSGMALAVEQKDGWRLQPVEASYDHFLRRGTDVGPGDNRPRRSTPDAGALLDAAGQLCGRRVDLLAIGTPLARRPIAGRRCCDNEVSTAYGARGAAVHSPSALRPGKISDGLRAAFEALGCGLCVRPPALGIIEVYPQAALIGSCRRRAASNTTRGRPAATGRPCPPRRAGPN